MLSSIEPDFKIWGTNVPGKPTAKTKVQVFRIVKNGNFRTIFGSTDYELGSLCLEQAQIKLFIRNHSSPWLLWADEMSATFFPFKVGDGKHKRFFVAGVRQDYRGGLNLFCNRFEMPDVMRARYRYHVVLPQLNLGN